MPSLNSHVTALPTPCACRLGCLRPNPHSGQWKAIFVRHQQPALSPGDVRTQHRQRPQAWALLQASSLRLSKKASATQFGVAGQRHACAVADSPAATQQLQFTMQGLLPALSPRVLLTGLHPSSAAADTQRVHV